MSFNDSTYLSGIKGAQAFISMDPNLLRLPEVVLERIQVKIEDNQSPSTNTEEEGDQAPGVEELKDEEWPNKNQQTPRPGAVSYYTRVGGAVYSSQSARSGKEHRKDVVRAGHKFGYDGSLGGMECGGGLRRGGKKKRGSWHHFRDRQRKLKEHNVGYVEEERQRGQRFSEEENEVLVANVLTHYKELCGHSAMKGSATRKRRLWQEVVNKVNSVATTYRTIEVCKKRYGDCRRAVNLKMAALQQQAIGRGDPHEQIRFNSWEDKLRQKISGTLSGGGQRVLDTCELTTLEVTGLSTPETPSSLICPSWTPDTAACSVVQSVAPGDTFSEGEQATSSLDLQIVSEWSEEEPLSTPAVHIPAGRTDPPEPKSSSPVEGGPRVSDPGPAQHYQRLQEELCRNLKHLTQSHNTELHKLRERVVEGNGRMVQHLEGLASEVRELNAHVRQIHMNQAHFNLMFQNYLSDTKQFYGAMVQAMRNLQQPQAVSPLPSPTSSPVPSPKPHPMPTMPNPLLLPAMTDYSALSPAGSAEPASASSTASEVPISNHYVRRPNLSLHPQPPTNH
ncbi:uncharacterized protein [Pyxicephalus adspersus]|uniref:uncharacterized protein n=1 Tax=Pyxicephalus adspersus TaxID=30357 RepID=UPI003B5B7646